MTKNKYDIVIVGSGPAGLTASIYAIRSNHSTLVISGSTPGGQLMLTTDVEDFPGFPGGVQGPELMSKIGEQAKLLGVDFIDKDVTKVDFKSETKKLFLNEKEIGAKTVIIATGSSAKWLGLESEKKLIGKGVSACAVCDGFFFKDKDVALIGGGDTAMREALYLAKLCKSVTVIHRRDKLRAQAVLENKAKETKNIKWIWDSIVEEFIGENKLEKIKLKNVKTNKISELKFDGAFVAIGHSPNTKFLGNEIKLEKGYIKVNDYVNTSVKGVFAAGDVKDYRYMQAVTAAGAGCMAAMEAIEYIDNKK